MEEIPQYLFGLPPMYGVKQESLKFSQATDIFFQLDLSDCQLTLSEYNLSAILKSDMESDWILWKGTLENGGLTLAEGSYFINLKHSNSNNLLPAGTYYLSLVGERGLGDTKTPTRTVIASVDFTIVNTAGSICAASTSAIPVGSSYE